MTRLDIVEDHWLYMTQNFESSFKALVGAGYSLKKVCKEMGYQRLLARIAYAKYYQTCIKRDVRQIIQLKDASLFDSLFWHSTKSDPLFSEQGPVYPAHASGLVRQ